MTEVGQAVARMSMASLFDIGDLHEFNNPLFSYLVDLIEGDLECEVQEYLEYELDENELVFHFAVFRHDKDHSWNERRMPYAWVSVDKDLDFDVDMDFN